MPSPFLGIPLLACLVLASAGGAQSSQPREPDATPPRRVLLVGTVSLPFLDSGIPGAVLPVVEVTLNGKGPFRFGIETGAAFVGINPSVAASLHLARSGGPEDAPEFQVDSLVAGAATFQDFKVTALPRPAAGVDGILGLSFFRAVLLTLDYPGRRALLSKGELPPANGQDILPMSQAGPFWAVPIRLAGKPFEAVVDTRSTAALSASPEVSAGLPFVGPLQVVGRAGGVGIPLTEVKAGRLAGAATLGRYTFPSPVLAIRSLPPGFPVTPLLGSVVLRHFVVTLDQRNARIRFKTEGPTTIALPEPARRPAAPPAGPTAPPPAGTGR